LELICSLIIIEVIEVEFKMLKVILLGSFIIFSFVGGWAQKENSNFSDSSILTDKLFQELKLDVTTPEDAIQILGKPNRDEFDIFSLGGKNGIFQVSIESIFKAKEKEKSFRKLTYKKLQETDDLTLRFFEGKLVHIIFDYDLGKKEKRIPANSLSEKYKTDFIILQGLTKDSKLSDFEGQKENSIPKVYGILYTLLGVQKDAVYFIRVENNNSKAFGGLLLKNRPRRCFPDLLVKCTLLAEVWKKSKCRHSRQSVKN